MSKTFNAKPLRAEKFYFYDIDTAEKVTATGRELVKKLKADHKLSRLLDAGFDVGALEHLDMDYLGLYQNEEEND